ncbi:MAG: type II toxin-antitoxin system HicB family antitoxin, partial [Thermoflexales bacterium]|nr:type II toxin-antitoxin system HicB family antitoxin [Thermoflexales bacterium]
MAVYPFTVVIEPDESGFHAYVPALPGCHTFGETVDEARKNIVQALELHLQCMLEDDVGFLRGAGGAPPQHHNTK